ncbi:MAG: nucleotide exchange factor GrpE [Gammaproteobacteria bacterium]|nr:nucleotide exchange factor GrpE [Gammaproteobacteria bacterium]
MNEKIIPEENHPSPETAETEKNEGDLVLNELTLELDQAKKRLEETEGKIKTEQDRFLRAQAELQNVLKRAERDVENAYKYALERFVIELLPVIDSLEQALEAKGEGNKDNTSHMKGVQLTLEIFLKVLSKFGVHPIPAMNLPFNPVVHEAISVQETLEVKPNMVLQVFQKGYLLRDRVIRAARVIVSKGPS